MWRYLEYNGTSTKLLFQSSVRRQRYPSFSIFCILKQIKNPLSNTRIFPSCHRLMCFTTAMFSKQSSKTTTLFQMGVGFVNYSICQKLFPSPLPLSWTTWPLLGNVLVLRWSIQCVTPACPPLLQCLESSNVAWPYLLTVSLPCARWHPGGGGWE